MLLVRKMESFTSQIKSTDTKKRDFFLLNILINICDLTFTKIPEQR